MPTCRTSKRTPTRRSRKQQRASRGRGYRTERERETRARSVSPRGSLMISKYFVRCIQAIALTLVGAMPLTMLHAQGAARTSLQEQLEAQYPLATITTQGGCSVTSTETKLALQKPGFGALPANVSASPCAAHYKNGAITKTG